MFLINSRKKIAEFSYASIKGETKLRNKLIIDTLYISKKNLYIVTKEKSENRRLEQCNETAIMTLNEERFKF